MTEKMNINFEGKKHSNSLRCVHFMKKSTRYFIGNFYELYCTVIFVLMLKESGNRRLTNKNDFFSSIEVYCEII
jgi:hypothetical protein